MTKKTAAFILSSLIALLFVSFAMGETTWDRDLFEHWILNETDERTNVGAHQMNKDTCEICSSSFWVYDDGSAEIHTYNAYEDLTHYSYYESDGVLSDDYVYIYKYDDSGKKLASFTYYFGILTEESEYALDPFGNSIIIKSIGFNDDGSESVTLCDNYGNTILSSMTDENGNLVFEETFEYTYGDDGFPLRTIQSTRFDDGSTFRMESDEMGNRVFETQIDADGTVVYAFDYSYEYDENGRMLREIISEDGRVTYETMYAYSDDPDDFWGYQCMTIDYFENGSKTVCELDEFGDIISETSYNADGNIIS